MTYKYGLNGTRNMEELNTINTYRMFLRFLKEFNLLKPFVNAFNTKDSKKRRIGTLDTCETLGYIIKNKDCYDSLIPWFVELFWVFENKYPNYSLLGFVVNSIDESTTREGFVYWRYKLKLQNLVEFAKQAKEFYSSRYITNMEKKR